MTPAAIYGRLLVALLATVLTGAAAPDRQVTDFNAWAAAPLVDFSKLGVSYWRVQADPEAVVTITRGEIHYSGPCDTASIPYRPTPDGGLDTFPAWTLGPSCGSDFSVPFLRFYLAVRQSSEVRTLDGAAAFGWASQPMTRLQRFEPEGLEFRRWQVAEFAVDGRMTKPDMGFRGFDGSANELPPPLIVFERGRLDGSPTCGGLVGVYRLQGSAIEIEAGWRLAGKCSAPLERQNDRVVDDLSKARRVEPEGRRMLLLDGAGQRLLVLAPA